jgi:hypothetical protein
MERKYTAARRTLLVAQCDDWIQSGGSDGREHAEDDAGDGGENAEAGERHRLDEKMPEDSAFRDGDHHDREPPGRAGAVGRAALHRREEDDYENSYL